MGNQDALPDAFLELALLVLNSPLCLLRAASRCKRWRRIIISDAFLSLHIRRRSIVAGFYYNDGLSGRPRFEPSPSTATVDARRFSLDFLPGDYHRISWRMRDSRGSLLLLLREGRLTERRDLIVCEPLTRRFMVIPHPSPFSSYWNTMAYCNTMAALLDGEGESNKGGGEAIGMSSFRVLLCLDNEAGRIRAYMFTSGSSSYWRETGIDMPAKLRAIGFAAGRRYWHDGKKTVVTLDQSALKFSSFVLPNHVGWGDLIGKVTLAIGHDGEARIVVDGNGNMLMIFARRKGGGDGKDAEEWVLEKNIQLSAAMLCLPRLPCYHLTWDQHEDVGMVRIRVPGAPGTAMVFNLDMETMEVERLPAPSMMDYVSQAYPTEFLWPPSLCACCTQHNA